MKKYIHWFICGCFGVIALAMLYYFIIVYNIPQAEQGTFGDSFGALNALFTGLAFAGVIITILIQLEELRTTRDELRKSIDAQEKSQRALNDQLNVMQSSHKLHLLENYLTLVKRGGQTPNDELIQKIITQETEKIFFADEYKDLVRPNLIFKALTNSKRPPMSKVYIQEFIIENNNSDLIDLTFDLVEEVNLVESKGVLKLGEQLKFKIESNEGEYNIPITYKGRIVKNKYEQILNLKVINKNLSVSITEPKLIERWNA